MVDILRKIGPTGLESTSNHKLCHPSISSRFLILPACLIIHNDLFNRQTLKINSPGLNNGVDNEGRLFLTTKQQQIKAPVRLAVRRMLFGPALRSQRSRLLIQNSASSSRSCSKELSRFRIHDKCPYILIGFSELAIMPPQRPLMSGSSSLTPRMPPANRVETGTD
jgi:hypothetical protein